MTEAQTLSEDDEALAAEYALGVLPAGERRVFAARAAADKSLSDRVTFWDEQFSPMAEAIAPVAPPARALSQIESRLFVQGTETGRAGLFGSLRFWQGLSFASLAALAIVGGLLLRDPVGGTATGPSFVATIAAENGSLNLVALYDPQSNSLRLTRSQGEPATGRSFELWLIEGGNAPVSLGVLPVEASGSIILAPETSEKLAGATLAISDEPAGGSPTGQPTGAVLGAGPVVAI
jgi:anti-sigma-K factor RskA